MSQVNQNFHKFSTELPDWLNFHMTPEEVITFKISDNKLEYNFKEFKAYKKCVEEELTSLYMKDIQDY